MCVLTLIFLPQHTAWETKICKNPVIKNSRRIHQRIQPHHRGAQKWVYFEIRRGCYGLPQSGMLANKQLGVRLEKEGYYEARTNPGLWRHKWRPIKFCLVVDDFGVEYVGKQHAEHLANILKKYHNITEYWEGKKYAGIDLVVDDFGV